MGDIKWLHLSDFHTGKDRYAQIKLFQKIHTHMREMKEDGIVPDMIFITGDVANQGLKEQYETFSEEFLLPLVDIYDPLPAIYIVPGNHDVDRKKCTLAAGHLYDIPRDQSHEKFFDTDEEGFEERRQIFERFEAFHAGFEENLCFTVQDIFEKKGCFTDIKDIGGSRIGIIGINTAWLSNSDGDEQRLRAGKWALEEALDALEGCRFKLVLGHHPVGWLAPEERKEICTLLARHKAIYLHGHMHANSGELMAAVENGFLALQSGAAFQTRGEIYYNSLYWGILDPDSEQGTVAVMPRRWSGSEGRFVLDASGKLPEAFRKADQWVFPCEVLIGGAVKQREKANPAAAPSGWDLIDEAFIRGRKAPAKKDILKYFDGREPSYDEIFSSYIPAREIVEDLKEELVKYDNDLQMKCILLTGAGGEGKTTVMLQTVRALCEEKGWKALILRQPEKGMSLNDLQIMQHTKEGHWVLGIDNCVSVAAELFRLLGKLRQRKTQNVHFLLCARDTDWINSEAEKLPWSDSASFSRRALKGIREEDAGRIVTAWKALGDEGLGKLKGLSLRDAKIQLVQFSLNAERNDPDEGALLGAMLATRYGDELHNHVREMLRHLDEKPLNNGTLLGAFVYIVAMHSEKQYFLSKPVMAQLYHLPESQVKKKILGPLGDEAASTVSGDMIFTRHGSIAESARKILEDEFHVDFDGIFEEMVGAAIGASKNGIYVEKLGKWRYLSEHFVGTNNTLAVNIDKKALKLEPYDEYFLVHLSKLYRKLEQPELAVKLFRDISYSLESRASYCEWALAEANNGNRAASVCLSAYALSDQAKKRPIDLDNANINLYSIAVTFLELYRSYRNQNYFLAMAAALYLKKKLHDEQAGKQPKMSKQEQQRLQNTKMTGDDAHRYLRQGILTAEQNREIDFRDDFPRMESLEFKKIFAMTEGYA